MSKARNILELLFESRARVRMLKLLFRNSSSSFTATELAERMQEPLSEVQREIKRKESKIKIEQQNLTNSLISSRKWLNRLYVTYY